MGKQSLHVQRHSIMTMLIDYLVLTLKTVGFSECSKIEGTEAFMENLNTPHVLFILSFFLG